jgi:hypothetical protein
VGKGAKKHSTRVENDERERARWRKILQKKNMKCVFRTQHRLGEVCGKLEIKIERFMISERLLKFSLNNHLLLQENNLNCFSFLSLHSQTEINFSFGFSSLILEGERRREIFFEKVVFPKDFHVRVNKLQ